MRRFIAFAYRHRAGRFLLLPLWYPAVTIIEWCKHFAFAVREFVDTMRDYEPGMTVREVLAWAKNGDPT